MIACLSIRLERNVSGALLLACGLATPAPALAQTPKSGGTLTYAVTGEAPTYDCHATTTFAAMHVLAPHYSLLIKVDQDKYPAVRGDAAQSWTAAPDGKSYTFKLHPNVLFHDGTKLTSRDVKATYDRLRAPPQGVLSVRKAAFEDITAIDTPDPTTVVFTLKQPDPLFLDTMSIPFNCLYSADLLAKDPRAPEKTILGSGPFTHVEHVNGSHWVGKKFDKYFLAGKPHLDGFKAFFIKSTALATALNGGQVMAEFRTVTPPERDQLKEAMGDKIAFQETPWLCRLDLFFNAKQKPFDDPRVRRALQIAIDRWGGSAPLSKIASVKGISGPLRPGSDDTLSPSELEGLAGYGRNIEAARAEAKKLLAEAGVGDLKVKLLNRNIAMPFTPVGIFVVDQWRRIGVTAEHVQLDVSQQKNNLNAGDYQTAIDAFCADSDDPRQALLQYLSKSRSPRNVVGNEAPDVDALYDSYKATADIARRKTLVADMQKKIIESGHSVPIIWYSRIVAHAPALKGWKAIPTHLANQDLTDVWLDQ